MRIHWLQHVRFEGLGIIERWALRKKHSLTATRLFTSDSFPDIDSFDTLIVMGGPMGVHDTGMYPWLLEEKKFIRSAIKEGKAVLGICLGAQLIASALGARVSRNREKEIGWFDVRLSEEAWNYRILDFLPQRFEVFQWHGDTFGLPKGAQSLAWSEACENQAFIYDKRVIALQFHLESTPRAVQALVENCKDEIDPRRPFQMSPEEILAPRTTFRQMNRQMSAIMDYLASVTPTAEQLLQRRRERLPLWY